MCFLVDVVSNVHYYNRSIIAQIMLMVGTSNRTWHDCSVAICNQLVSYAYKLHPSETRECCGKNAVAGSTHTWSGYCMDPYPVPQDPGDQLQVIHRSPGISQVRGSLFPSPPCYTKKCRCSPCYSNHRSPPLDHLKLSKCRNTDTLKLKNVGYISTVIREI